MPDTEIKSYQCRHLFADGHRCGSRALRAEQFCFYHHTTRKPAPRQDTSPNCSTFDLPFPEDRPAIQSGIGEVLRRLATNTIDNRRAGLILYGLQIASMNLPKPATTPNDDHTVEDIIDDPTHGPLAPPAPYVHPEDRRPPTLARQLLDKWANDPTLEDFYVNVQASIDQAPTNNETITNDQTMGAPSFPASSERVGSGLPGKPQPSKAKSPSEPPELHFLKQVRASPRIRRPRRLIPRENDAPHPR